MRRSGIVGRGIAAASEGVGAPCVSRWPVAARQSGECTVQRFRGDWLDEVAGESGRGGLRTGGVARVRAERDDRHVAPVRQPAQQPRRRETVSSGHVDIHQYRVASCTCGNTQRSVSAGRGDRADLPCRQQFCPQLTIDRVVIDEQHAQPGDLRRMGVGREGFGGGAAQLHAADEFAACAGNAVDVDAAVHPLHEPADDRQAKAGAAVVPGDTSIGLREWFEQPRQHLGRDADAGIGDAQFDDTRIVRVPECCAAFRRHVQQSSAERDRAVMRELHGVAQQIVQYLAQAHRVTAQHRVCAVAGVSRHRHAAFRGERREQVATFEDQAVERQRYVIQFDCAGVDAGEVEHVVHERLQLPARVLHHAHVTEQRGAVARVGGQRARADDGVQGRAYFVAHVRKKLSARLGGGLGALPLPFGQFALLTFGDVQQRALVTLLLVLSGRPNAQRHPHGAAVASHGERFSVQVRVADARDHGRVAEQVLEAQSLGE